MHVETMANDAAQRSADEKEGPFAAETRAIISCAFEILNHLGHGLLEKPYENALVVECSLRGIPVVQQRPHDVIYKQVSIGLYVPDLIAFERVIIETKVIDRISDHELGQVLNYLKITGYPVGLILNFRRARLEWKRVVSPALQSQPQSHLPS